MTGVLLDQDEMDFNSGNGLSVPLSEFADSHTSINRVESPTLLVEAVGMSETNVTQMLVTDEGSQSSAPRLAKVTCTLPPRAVPQPILFKTSGEIDLFEDASTSLLSIPASPSRIAANSLQALGCKVSLPNNDRIEENAA